MQQGVVIVLIAACVAFVAWYAWRSLTAARKPDCGGCCGCGTAAPTSSADERKPALTQFLPADALRRRKQ